MTKKIIFIYFVSFIWLWCLVLLSERWTSEALKKHAVRQFHSAAEFENKNDKILLSLFHGTILKYIICMNWDSVTVDVEQVLQEHEGFVVVYDSFTQSVYIFGL